MLLLAGMLLIGGCAQYYAGITRADVTLGPDGKVISASFVDGKEKASAALIVELPNGGKLVYSAQEIRAFEAHAIRAAVEQALLETTGQVVPEVAAAITRSILGSQAIGLIGQAAEGKAALEAGKLKLEGEKMKLDAMKGAKPAP